MNYINQYNKDHYDRIVVVTPKGTLGNIRKAAEKDGVSVSEFIRRFIPENLLVQREGTKEKAEER